MDQSSPPDAAFMRRALALAEQGRGRVSPNPLVGAVIVADGEVVGEGFHAAAGEPHAEAVALAAAGERARGATLYVTLEPCTHTGRTPPCSDALIAAGIGRVVVAVRDPNPEAAGGAERLEAAGVAVAAGVLEDVARRQNEIFLHTVATGRPFVIGKAATSLDGRIAAADGSSQWLTGAVARERAHRLRAEVDAVVVGSGTVLADDPALTCRLSGWDGPQPLRVVLDRRGRVRPPRRVLDDAAETVVLAEADPKAVLATLWDRGVRSALVEGGAAVLGSFLGAGLVDRLEVHVAPLLLGSAGRPLLDGPWPSALAGVERLRLDALEHVGEDALLTLRPRRTT